MYRMAEKIICSLYDPSNLIEEVEPAEEQVVTVREVHIDEDKPEEQAETVADEENDEEIDEEAPKTNEWWNTEHKQSIRFRNFPYFRGLSK